MSKYKELGQAMHNYANAIRTHEMVVGGEETANLRLKAALAEVFPDMKGPADEEWEAIELVSERIQYAIIVGVRSEVNAPLHAHK